MRLTGLFIHPIKACRGIRVESARVTDRGLENDRRFMIVDEHGKFITQREEQRLQRVMTAIEGDTLALEVPGFGGTRLPARPEGGEPLDVVVWRSHLRAAAHAEGSAFFTAFLGRPASLVYMPDALARSVNPAFGRPTDRTSFSDGYPFLLLSEASLRDLSDRVGETMVVERFRTNLLIDGDAPYVEDSMTTFTVGDVRFHGVKPCARCVVTTIDPDTFVTGKEPLRTLARFRRDAEGGVLFGMNLVHDGTGSVRVGDAVHVEQRSNRS